MTSGEAAYAEALKAVCDELGLPEHYRSCVKPIVLAPRERWPRCCGSSCEPCNDLLRRVAEGVLKRWSPGET